MLCELAESIKKHVPIKYRLPFYTDAIEAFTDCDCDTIDECMGIDPALDVAVLRYESRWGQDALMELAEAEVLLTRLTQP